MPTPRPSHPYLYQIEPYAPPDLEEAAALAGLEVDELIRLFANENLYGPSPRVGQALAGFGQFHFHPDYAQLKEAVARYAGVPSDHLVVSNGADEMIDLLIRLFAEPGEAIVTCPPTFSMYRFYAQVNRCQVLTAARRETLYLNPEAIESVVHQSDGLAKLLFFASPGNPSGEAIPLSVVARLLALPLLVVVDEAYIEFGGESALGLLPDHHNLVILRTFSKWAGMAGLRLGYALLSAELARPLERIRPPYNVNAAAVVAALATLADTEAVQANVEHIVEERGRLREALDAINWLEPLPSQANFLLCRVHGRDARSVTDALRRRGILVRHVCSSQMVDEAAREYIRISVGRRRENAAVVETLKQI